MNVAVAPLASRPFRLLLAGRTVSLVGSGLAPVAVAFAVLDLTGSVGDLGLVLAARSAATVVFVLVGGVVADRVPRHRLLLVSGAVAGFAQTVAASLLLTHHATVPALAVIEAINGASSAFVLPASAGLLPRTVEPDQLQPANALFRLATNAALVVGSSLGGILVAGVGPGWGVAVDAASYLVSAALCGAVRPAPALAPASVPADLAAGAAAEDAAAAATDVPSRQHPLVDLREGWREFASRPWLWSVVVAFGFANAAHAAGVGTLGPAVADTSFGRAAWGLVLATETIGMLIGGVLMLRWRVERPLRAGTAAVTLLALPMLALGIHPTLSLLVPLGLVAGVGLEVFGVGWDLSLQQHVPADRLSRVYAYDALGSFVMIPVGQAVAGPAAALLGLSRAVVACALVVAVSVGGALAVPAVRALRRTDVSSLALAAPEC